MDKNSRTSPIIPCDHSMTGSDVIQILSRLTDTCETPTYFRSDNGSEVVAHQIKQWVKDLSIDTHYYNPDRLRKNSFVEKLTPSSVLPFISRVLSDVGRRQLTDNPMAEKVQFDPATQIRCQPFSAPILQNFRIENPNLESIKVSEIRTLKLDQQILAGYFL